MNPEGIPCTPYRPTLATFADGSQTIIVPLNAVVIGRVDVPADGRKAINRQIIIRVEATQS